MVDKITNVNNKFLTQQATSFLNVFHEPVTPHDLKHRFDILNIHNDGRIPFKEFLTVAEDLGIAFTGTEGREVYDKITNCGKNQVLDEEAFTGGYALVAENENVAIFYKKLLGGGQYDYQDGRTELAMEQMSEALKDHKEDWSQRIQF
ncbi:hypothetical protein RFI_16100 [Reticulomyxa filosa]|uniref:EF-hand domain-containing protein n=1 Tax=Reticulomyxa filosa TaxID=46433 RepID=X6N5S6_RETFI|nr:hypothetical protein RFI_16100 [Reticulomyxa filosa]|eukprot:ETO21104.1 hypothetical protein RFI_16100 [Reticulomyxa filosa]